MPLLVTKLLCGSLLIILASIFIQARAADPDEILDNPALELRARKISYNLRCVVCQSQNIDDSDAPLAKDMRILVRERLVAGDSDKEIYAFMVDRYGDYVLLRPPVQKNTLLLWLTPIIILVGASFALGIYFKRMKNFSTDEEPK